MVRIHFSRADDFKVQASSSQGVASGLFRLPWSPDEWERIRTGIARPGRNLETEAVSAQQPSPQRIGEELFRALFSGPIGLLWVRSVVGVARYRGLRLKLHFDRESPGVSLLHSLPWELLRQPDTRDSLALSRLTPVVRYVDALRPVRPLPWPAKLRVLVVIAAPSGLSPLDVAREQREIQDSWGSDPEVEVSFLEKPRAAALRQALIRQSYHILYFIGHGELDRQSGEGRLFFESPDGTPYPVSGEALTILLEDISSLRLIFLNAGERPQGPGVNGLAFSGMARALVMAGLPAAVVMQFPISDVAATVFSRAVHLRLVAGDPIDTAVTEGRLAIHAADPSSMEWASPVLFSRVADGRIFDWNAKGALRRAKTTEGSFLERFLPKKGKTIGPPELPQEKEAPEHLPVRVFLSYSHDSPEHKSRILALCDRLRSNGIDAWIDQYETSPPEGWPRWCATQVRQAGFVLVVCTEAYERRFRGAEEPRLGLGGVWEGYIATQELYESGARNTKFVPVFFPPSGLAQVPDLLRGATFYDLGTDEGYWRLYRHLTGQPDIKAPLLGEFLPLPSGQREFPEPKYPDEQTRRLSEALDEAYQRLESLTVAGVDTTSVRGEILQLRREIREGGRLRPGDSLCNERFKLLEPLGRGGFATVWKAYDRNNKRLVAVKVLHGQHSEDRTRRDRFFRGARKMAELGHPGIVRVIEPQLDDGSYYFFAMEYVEGGDLRQEVLEDKLSREAVVPLILAVGSALEFAHERGVVHRDVKPANILLSGGQPKLTDFDLVRAFDTTGGTQTQGMMGTFLYTAPEVMSDAKGASFAADVYSLAMTAVFAFYGRDIPADVWRRPDMFVQRLDCPPEIRDVLCRGIAWDPEERPRSVAELCGELRLERAAAPVVGAPSRQAPQSPMALPPLNILRLEQGFQAPGEEELLRLGEKIRTRCGELGVEGTIEGINPGPVITSFELQPAPGVKVSQIVNLQDDLALALEVQLVRIDRMPGRSTLGIEVPNRERAMIRLGSLLADDRFRKSPSVLTMAIGTDIHGEPYYADLATMPHLLVAGATGAGKSVGLRSMITSILYKATREEVQFIFIDSKRIELGVYADIPHLKCDVVADSKKAVNALRWAVAEMESRYRLLSEAHVRSIADYNRVADLKPLPCYVVVIDELGDLMAIASSDVEDSIARLAQMARAIGIHLIVATQRPLVDVLTSAIKANFPSRISFATASRHESRIILDQVGAEKLLGKGDLLMMPPGSARVMRLHGAYISEQETAALVRWLRKNGPPPDFDPDLPEPPEGVMGGGGVHGEDEDELFEEAARLVVAERNASASFLQRRMRIGFSRAARLIDRMEREGLISAAQGSKPRKVLADRYDQKENEPL